MISRDHCYEDHALEGTARKLEVGVAGVAGPADGRALHAVLGTSGGQLSPTDHLRFRLPAGQLFGCSIIGAALAIVQVLPELRRDQWATLLHRPVSRSVIFFGKAFSGLLLYLCATMLPFLACVAYVAIPGQFAAPLVPGMLLPGLSDIAFGPVLYFAALLLCLHGGRWFGSRGVIGLTILPALFFHLGTGWPFLAALLCSLVFLLAGREAMLGNGAMPRPGAGRTAFVFLVFTGAEVAVLLLIAMLHLLPAGPPAPEQTAAQFQIAQDGKVFVSTYGRDGLIDIRDMQGKVVTDDRYSGNAASENFCEILPLTRELGSGNSARDIYLASHPRNALRFVVNVSTNQSKEQWYILVRQNCFIGYDKLSRRCVGILDADGFKAAGAKPHAFRQPLRESIISFREPQLFWSGPDVYAMRFPERNVHTFHLPGESIYGAVDVNGLRSDGPVGIASNRGLHLMDTQGVTLFTIPFPHDPAVWPTLSLGCNADADRFYLQSGPSPLWSRVSNPKPDPEPTFLDELDRHGKILHTYSIPARRPAVEPGTWVDQVSLFTSPFLAFIGMLDFHFFTRTDAVAHSDLGSLMIRDGGAALCTLLLCALTLALLAWFWARGTGCSPRRASLWAIFVFCFGLPGLLTFRLSAHWPLRVRCYRCGHRRPIDLEQCPSCGEPWPIPESSGTEIFDLSQ